MLLSFYFSDGNFALFVYIDHHSLLPPGYYYKPDDDPETDGYDRQDQMQEVVDSFALHYDCMILPLGFDAPAFGNSVHYVCFQDFSAPTVIG